LESREVLTVYNVGPGLAYTTLGAVPWNNLQPGDAVNIHWQANPYHEKIMLSASGTAAQHITINGIAGPNGQLPVLDGTNATSSPNSPRFSYTPMEDMGLIVLYRDQTQAYGYHPSFIDINNLQLQGANAGTAYTGYGGDARTYAAGASGVWMEGTSDVTIHGCTITNDSNGVFAKSGGDTATTTYRVTLDSNYLYGNGVAGNYLYHDSYIEADGAVYQYNRYGPLRAGAPGNALKDRSAGTVIRYNYIQDGGHLMDLVDSQDGAGVLTTEPSYLQTYVYGNVLISDADGPTFLIHYGGDDYNYANYRNGTLYFYNNTVVSQDDQSDRWRTILFQLDTNSQTLDARNNIFFNGPATPGAAATNLELMNTAGVANFSTNWISPGWGPSYDTQPFTGTITGTGNFISNSSNNPGFANLSTFDLHLLSTSGAIDKGVALAPSAAANYPVSQQYVYHQGGQARTVSGAASDLGAFEFGGATSGSTASSLGLSGPTGATAGSAFTVTLTARDGSGNVATGYTGTVHFTSSDGQAGLPADYTFTQADAGVHTFTVTLKTAGSQTVTATDKASATLNGNASVSVSAAAASTLQVSGYPTPTAAGSAHNFMLTALDLYGNVATGFTGAVSFTSSDPLAVLPPAYTFTSTDAGKHTFSATFNTAGTQSITGQGGGLTASQSGITVQAAVQTATHYGVSAPTGSTAGSSFSVTVSALDASNQVVSGYAGTVHFTSSDGLAGLPADYTFTQADAGAHTFTVTLKTAGSQTVTATDKASATLSGNATVSDSPGAASTLQVSGYPTPTTVGVAHSFTVTALDAYGNVATGFASLVSFTSSDPLAVLPPAYTFTSADAGKHTFSATFNTAGTQSITATDPPSVPTTPPTGTQSGITVNAVSNDWHQASAADFNAGSFSGTALASPTSGGLQLASTFSDDFSGPTLSSAWSQTNWSSSGKVSFSGGVVSLSATSILSTQATGSGVEGYVKFAAAPYQHFGLATGLASVTGNSWAIFSTFNTSNTLYARVNANGVTQDLSLGALPSGFHDYKVVPVSGGFQFYVDGKLKATLSAALPAGTALNVALSSYNSTALKADWVRLLSYPSTGTYTSAVFDATRLATWGTASWTASLPAGTTVTVQTRSGNTATPDSTWSSWTAVTNGGQVNSPAGRYLQYRVLFTTTNSTQTAVLSSLDFNWS
jgi:hypothetical protein